MRSYFVLLPYEITLFSNTFDYKLDTKAVLLPYEITLFSNIVSVFPIPCLVLLPYEITLFSNLQPYEHRNHQFYYLMKLHYSQTDFIRKAMRSQFYYLMKLHYSQTSNKLCHYNAQGNSQDIVYIIVLIIITVNNTQIRVQNMYLFKF